MNSKKFLLEQKRLMALKSLRFGKAAKKAVRACTPTTHLVRSINIDLLGSPERDQGCISTLRQSCLERAQQIFAGSGSEQQGAPVDSARKQFLENHPILGGLDRMQFISCNNSEKISQLYENGRIEHAQNFKWNKISNLKYFNRSARPKSQNREQLTRSFEG